ALSGRHPARRRATRRALRGGGLSLSAPGRAARVSGRPRALRHRPGALRLRPPVPHGGGDRTAAWLSRDRVARDVPSPGRSRASPVPRGRRPSHGRGSARDGRRHRGRSPRSGPRPALSAMSGSLWASTDLARAYADVRTDLSPAARAVWADAFRAAVPSTPLRRLLDVGCGTGRFTAFLADVFGAAVVGVDASVAMLEARSPAPGASLAFLGAEVAALP